MRKTDRSSKLRCSASLSSIAELRSRPNGFSTTTLAPSAQPDRAAVGHRREQARRQREVVQRMLRRRRALCAMRANVCRLAVVAVDVAHELARREKAASSTPSSLASRLSRIRSRKPSMLEPPRATPMTGTSSVPC